MTTAVFVDGAYLDKVCEIHFGGARIDYRLFVNEIVGGEDHLFRVYYYHCLPHLSQAPTSEEQIRMQRKERFYSAISKLPKFQVRLGRLAFRGKDHSGKPIFVQKSVDVMIAVDMIQLAATHQVNRIVMVAADEDFIPAIKAVKEYGVLTEIWLSRNGPQKGSGSQSLLDAFDAKNYITRQIIKKTKR